MSTKHSPPPPPGIANAVAAREVHEIIQNLSRSMVEELSSRIAAIKTQPSARISKTIGDFFPELLERHFVRGILEDANAARTRALLQHALTTLSLQDFNDVNVVQSPQGLAARRADQDDGEVLTSAEAAKLLNVSRTYLNTLVEEGKLGPIERTEGGHRRIPKSVVLAYKQHSRRRQEKALEEMSKAAQDLGLYDTEMEGVPRRKAR